MVVDVRDNSAAIAVKSSAGGHRDQFWRRQGRPLLDVVHSAFALPTTVLPTLRGAPKDGFWRGCRDV